MYEEKIILLPTLSVFRKTIRFSRTLSVVFYDSKSTVAIEVKSVDSDDLDMRWGVFQCIKRAVFQAMDVRS